MRIGYLRSEVAFQKLSDQPRFVNCDRGRSASNPVLAVIPVAMFAEKACFSPTFMEDV